MTGGFILILQITAVIMVGMFRAAGARKLGLLSLTSLVAGGAGNARGKASCAASASTVDLSNPLKDKRSLPKFAEITPDHVLPAVEEDLA